MYDIKYVLNRFIASVNDKNWPENQWTKNTCQSSLWTQIRYSPPNGAQKTNIHSVLFVSISDETVLWFFMCMYTYVSFC
jgi:hypothetical protein